MTKIGVKTVLVTGMSLLTVGLLYFTQVSVDGSYVRDLLPGFLIIAMGMAFAFVAISIAALAGVEAKDAGLASGLINTSQQIGGALGLAILSTIAISRTDDVMAEAHGAQSQLPHALTEGFSAAFTAGAGFAILGVILGLVLIKGRPRDEGSVEVDGKPVTEAV